MNYNTFWGDTDNIVIRVKLETPDEVLKMLKEMHKNAVIIKESEVVKVHSNGKDKNIADNNYSIAA